MTDATGPQFVMGGYRYGTSTRDQDTYGYYWSSSAYTSATNAYYLYLLGTNSTVRPAHYGNKRYALTLRCLAQ